MKKFYFLFALLFFSQISFSQLKLFYDIDGKRTKDLQYAVTYRIVTIDSTSAPLKKNEKTYSVFDILQTEKNFLEKTDENNKRKYVQHGLTKNWDESGYLKSEMEYADNKLHGKLVTYWPDGKIKRKEMYEAGKFISGNCFDSLGNEIKHFPYEQMPQFPGGDQMLFNYLNYSVRYPVVAQEAKIQGRVIVQFYVNTSGVIEDLKVVRSVSYDLDQESLRVIRNSPNWIPGKIDGVPVRVKYTLPVNFRLQ